MLQVGLIWTDQASWYKRNTLFGRQEVAGHRSCLSDVPLSLHPGADLSESRCVARHSHGWGVVSARTRFAWVLFLFCALLCLTHVTALSLPSPCFSAPDVISCLLLLLTSHGKYTELLHVRNILPSEAVLLYLNGTKALALGEDKAEDKLLQVCSRATWGLTSSSCLCWSDRLKWQQEGWTLNTRKSFLGTGMLKQ